MGSCTTKWSTRFAAPASSGTTGRYTPRATTCCERCGGRCGGMVAWLVRAASSRCCGPAAARAPVAEGVAHYTPCEALEFCALLLLHRYTLNCQCPEERWAEVQGAFRAAGSSFRIFSSGSGTQGYPDAL